MSECNIQQSLQVVSRKLLAPDTETLRRDDDTLKRELVKQIWDVRLEHYFEFYSDFDLTAIVDYSDYPYCTLSATITRMLYDFWFPDQLHDMYPDDPDYDPDNITWGYGFINVAGLMWGNDSVDYTVNPNSSTSGVESWSTAYNELMQAGIKDENIILLVWVADDENAHNDGRYGVYPSEWGNREYTERLLYEDLANYQVITPFVRWRNNDNDTAVVSEGGSFSLSFDELTRYYPGARRIEGTWESHDRREENDVIGHVKRRRSGSWGDVLNSVFIDEDNTGFRRISAAWDPIELYTKPES